MIELSLELNQEPQINIKTFLVTEMGCQVKVVRIIKLQSKVKEK